MSKSDGHISQITRCRLNVATKRPGNVNGDQWKSGEVSGGDWRPVEARGGEGKGDQGRGVEIKGGVWGLVEAWEARGPEPHC